MPRSEWSDALANSHFTKQHQPLALYGMPPCGRVAKLSGMQDVGAYIACALFIIHSYSLHKPLRYRTFLIRKYSLRVLYKT